MTGFACGLPLRLAAIAGSVAVMIWLDPIIRIWLAIRPVVLHGAEAMDRVCSEG